MDTGSSPGSTCVSHPRRGLEPTGAQAWAALQDWALEQQGPPSAPVFLLREQLARGQPNQRGGAQGQPQGGAEGRMCRWCRTRARHLLGVPRLTAAGGSTLATPRHPNRRQEPATRGSCCGPALLQHAKRRERRAQPRPGRPTPARSARAQPVHALGQPGCPSSPCWGTIAQALLSSPSVALTSCLQDSRAAPSPGRATAPGKPVWVPCRSPSGCSRALPSPWTPAPRRPTGRPTRLCATAPHRPAWQRAGLGGSLTVPQSARGLRATLVLCPCRCVARPAPAGAAVASALSLGPTVMLQQHQIACHSSHAAASFSSW